MNAWPVIQKYDLTLMPVGGGYAPPRPAQAEYLELRLPDEWGNPDKTVSSQIRWARLSDGSELQPCEGNAFLSKLGKLRVFTKHPAHASCWLDQELE